MSQQSTSSTVAAVGIDIGKNTFHLVGLDECGAIVLRQKLSRGQRGQALLFLLKRSDGETPLPLDPA
jgi:transposase